MFYRPSYDSYKSYMTLKIVCNRCTTHYKQLAVMPTLQLTPVTNIHCPTNNLYNIPAIFPFSILSPPYI